METRFESPLSQPAWPDLQTATLTSSDLTQQHAIQPFLKWKDELVQRHKDVVDGAKMMGSGMSA